MIVNIESCQLSLQLRALKRKIQAETFVHKQIYNTAHNIIKEFTQDDLNGANKLKKKFRTPRGSKTGLWLVGPAVTEIRKTRNETRVRRKQYQRAIFFLTGSRIDLKILKKILRMSTA